MCKKVVVNHWGFAPRSRVFPVHPRKAEYWLTVRLSAYADPRTRCEKQAVESHPYKNRKTCVQGIENTLAFAIRFTVCSCHVMCFAVAQSVEERSKKWKTRPGAAVVKGVLPSLHGNL